LGNETGKGDSMNREELARAIRKDIDNICCIYASVGNAMHEEARERLAARIAHNEKIFPDKKRLKKSTFPV
jgi:hypothetical protein